SEIAFDQRLARTPEPAAVVIFGASGDLTTRKLMPALYNLSLHQMLPPETAIVGVARSEMDDDEFRSRMRAGVDSYSRTKPPDADVWDGFARRLSYLPFSFDDSDGYERLAAHLRDIDERLGTRGNRLFYLATAPEFFPVIARELGAAGLA